MPRSLRISALRDGITVARQPVIFTRFLINPDLSGTCNGVDGTTNNERVRQNYKNKLHLGGFNDHKFSKLLQEKWIRTKVLPLHFSHFNSWNGFRKIRNTYTFRTFHKNSDKKKI